MGPNLRIGFLSFVLSFPVLRVAGQAAEHGTPDGIEREYYPSGVLSQEGRYVNGKEEGVWKDYFPNGAIKQYGNYRNGVLADSAITYYSSGRVKEKVMVRNGKLIPDPRLNKVNL
jgi:antitoxin component YwqK of YwqJK toxin-antitoxin module